MRAEQRQNMMAMHKQQMEAMKVDVEKMKASLATMKTNVPRSVPPPRKRAGRATSTCGRRCSATWTRW
jgi:hypothetical protein